MMNIQIHTGDSINNYSPILAQWRIQYFNEFPYLYVGTFEYERSYIDAYIKGKDSMLVTVEIDNKVIAIASGIALLSEFDIVSSSAQLLKNLVKIETCAYLGEMIIDEEHRGQGLSRIIISKQEEYFKSLGYTHTCFLTVVRTNHPLEPQNYINPSTFWNPIGYIKTNIISSYNWPTIQPNGEVIEMDNEMVYWIKTL